MRITYDPKFNIAYLALKDKTGNINTIKLSDEVNIDISSDGTIYGVELLNANEQLANMDNGKLTFVNLLSGTIQELNIIP